MDNAYILLLIIKRGINVGDFILWYNRGFDMHGRSYCYADYLNERDRYISFIDDSCDFDSVPYDLSFDCMSEFEFRYFVSFLELRGELR